MRHAIPLAAVAALVLNATALLWPGNLGALRGARVVELLAIASIAVFFLVRSSARSERRIASISIFVSSLVLALSAPAALMPPAALRGEAWALWGAEVPSEPIAATPFAIWSVSFLIGGLAMHALTNRRWALLTRS